MKIKIKPVKLQYIIDTTMIGFNLLKVKYKPWTFSSHHTVLFYLIILTNPIKSQKQVCKITLPKQLIEIQV